MFKSRHPLLSSNSLSHINRQCCQLNLVETTRERLEILEKIWGVIFMDRGLIPCIIEVCMKSLMEAIDINKNSIEVLQSITSVLKCLTSHESSALFIDEYFLRSIEYLLKVDHTTLTTRCCAADCITHSIEYIGYSLVEVIFAKTNLVLLLRDLTLHPDNAAQISGMRTLWRLGFHKLEIQQQLLIELGVDRVQRLRHTSKCKKVQELAQGILVMFSV